MASITYADKTPGSTFTAANANEIKTVVNGKADALGADDNYVTDLQLAALPLENGGVVTLPTVTDNGDGTVNVDNDGLYNFYTESVGTDGIIQLAVGTGWTNQVLADETLSFVYADYNAGTPIYAITTSAPDYLANADWCPIFRVYRSGTTLHITNYDSYGTALGFKALYKNVVLKGFERQLGLILSTAATRISTVSSGLAWFGVQTYSLATNVAGTTGQLYEFYPVASAWTSALVTEYDSSYYSDGVNRIALGNNKYVAKYFWRGVKDANHVYYTHGNQYNNALDAYNEILPTPPPEITSHSIYVGKIVIYEGATNGVAYPRLWGGTALASGAVNHNDLTNIELAADGITNGHIDDQPQTIAGAKTFIEAVSVQNAAASDTDNGLVVKNAAGETTFTVDRNGDIVANSISANSFIQKSYSLTTQGLGANPNVYAGGFYDAPAAAVTLTNASLTQTYGTANKAEGAHVFIVAEGAGTTDGSDLVITVTGISITDAGVRNASDSEVIVADATALSTNQYLETDKKWLGQPTFALSSTAGTTFSVTFNYGFAKYEDFGNRDFTVTDFEIVGFAGANDTGFDVIFFKHSSTGWTYSAAAFVPGGSVICRLSTDYSTDDQLVASEHFAYKRAGLSIAITGSGFEGVVAKIITTANNAIEFATVHIGISV